MARIGNNLRLTSIFVALTGTLVAGSVQAQEYAAPGPYAGLGFAIGFDNFDTFGLPISFDPAYGFDVWGGYRFTPNFAGEVLFEYVNGFNVQDLPPSVEVKLQAITWTTNLKGYLLTGRWQPFALIGVGLGWQEAQSSVLPSLGFTAFTARFGGGLDFYLTESVALEINAAYNLQTGNLEGGDYVSLVMGAQYRF